jgi:photosystem II PsbU protein
MKVWGRFLALLSLIVTCFVFTGQPQAQAFDLSFIAHSNYNIIAVEGKRRNVGDDKLGDIGNKIDLNNSDILKFTKFKGFYPKLASIIIKNAPYEKVDDVLAIPGLTETQQKRLQANLDKFIVTPPAAVFLEGDERYNAGTY